MAQFRHRASGETVGATRAQSPKQIETQDRGWIQVGPGNWEITSLIPGIRPLVLEDPEFREQYEAVDADAQVGLAAPGPGTLQQSPQPTPAPPAHTAAQALPPQKTAEDWAAENRATQEAAIAAEKAKAEAADAGGDEGGTDAGTEGGVDPITGEASDDAGGEDLSVEGGSEPAAPEAEAGAETEPVALTYGGKVISEMSKGELKNACDHAGLAVGGNMEQLTERLLQHLIGEDPAG